MLGPAVAVERALEVLRGAERADRVAVAQEEQRDLGTGQELLDQHRARGEVVLGVGEGFRPVGRDDDALARGQTVGLDHVRSAELVERGFDVGDGGGAHGAPGRHARGIHHPLRERLRALELRRRLARSEHRHAVCAQGIRDAGDQRSLRADHDEVDRVLVRERGHRRAVERIDRDGGGVLRDLRRCRGDEDLVLRLLGSQSEDDRVLTSTGTEDENLHRSSLPRVVARVSVGGRAQFSKNAADACSPPVWQADPPHSD